MVNLWDPEERKKEDFMLHLGIIRKEEAETIEHIRHLKRLKNPIAFSTKINCSKKKKQAKKKDISPNISRPSTPINPETKCDMCRLKGAKDFCEGCGVFYHKSCIDIKRGTVSDYWACCKCLSFGVITNRSLPNNIQLLIQKFYKEKNELLVERGSLNNRLDDIKKHSNYHKKEGKPIKGGISRINSKIDSINKKIHTETITHSKNILLPEGM